MSFAKADQLLELATLVSAHRMGITLEDVTERFGCVHRTSQRMMGALEVAFPDVVASFGEDGRKRWRFEGGHLRDLLTLAPEELAALDLAISELNRAGSEVETRSLRRLKDKVLTLVPRRSMARLETDHEALLEAQGVIARPGPRPKIDEEAGEAILDAIKSCHLLELRYRSRKDETAKTRYVAPYGILSGARRYLVGRPVNDPDGAIRTYRLNSVDAAQVTDQIFTRPENFNLQDFANRAFGVYQNDAEYQARLHGVFGPRSQSTQGCINFTPIKRWRTKRTARSSSGSRRRASWKCAGTSMRGATRLKSWSRRV